MKALSIPPRSPLCARADVYRLLSACYYQPEAVFLDEDVFGQLASSMADAIPSLVSEINALEEYFRAAGVDALLLDYSQLFLGPFVIPAKPYGSAYLDGIKVVMGDSTMRVRALYREGGFEVDADFLELPDHVAVELEFLYLLCWRIAHAEADERSRLVGVKDRFLDEHLGRWIGPLAADIVAHAKTDYYRRLAQVTDRVVSQERLAPVAQP